jgi:hypothetical protein
VGKSAALTSSLFRDRVAWIGATFYLAIVLILWTPFNLHSGMPFETGFVYTSEISTWWNGFLFGADLSRMNTSTFFQLGYLLGELTGFRGSFVPYQIVYAALWWARSFLMFLIVRRLLPGQDLLGYLAGALVLVYSSDLATGWVGQMPQPAYIFWMLAAFYLLIRGLDLGSRVWLALAIFCEYMSLWTYESPIVIILLAPLLLLWLRRDAVRKWRATMWGWYTVPVIYLVVTAIRYERSGGHTYQESVLRNEWSIGQVFEDWLFNIGVSLRFWTWPGEQAMRAPQSQLALLAALAVVVLIGGMIALAVWRIPEVRTILGATAAGLVLMVFSFPAYLLLDSARSLWRTQMLSGLGAALFLSAVIVLCASVASAKWLRFGLLAALSACVAWYGSYSALAKSANHRRFWDQHQQAMAAVLHVAPRVKSGTLIILTNVPGGEGDPFGGDNLWFDMALRLAYPGTQVAGAYWHKDGTPARGRRPMVDASGRWSLRGNPLIQEGGADSILVIEYSDDGHASAAPRLPDFLGFGERASALYNPASRIEPGPPSERAVRRYGFRRQRNDSQSRSSFT